MKSCSIAAVVGQRRCVQELAREENGDGNCAERRKISLGFVSSQMS